MGNGKFILDFLEPAFFGREDDSNPLVRFISKAPNSSGSSWKLFHYYLPSFLKFKEPIILWI